jgi:hypothetical protein
MSYEKGFAQEWLKHFIAGLFYRVAEQATARWPGSQAGITSSGCMFNVSMNR